jgi:hypothetical protein
LLNRHLVRELFARRGVDALVELAHERVDADDGEDQPEDQAHQLKFSSLLLSTDKS